MKKEYAFFCALEKVVSGVLLTLAEDYGFQYAGWDWRIKSWKSIVEKLVVRHAGTSLFDLHDIIRYTVICGEEDFGNEVNEKLRILQNHGFEIIKIKNYWMDKSNPYNGINCQTSFMGQAVEIQFHTEDSLRVKETENHPLYEKLRVLQELHTMDADEEAEKLLDALWEIANNQRIPVGVELIG